MSNWHFSLVFAVPILWSILLALFSQPLWEDTPDPDGLFRSVIRILIIVPLCSALAIGIVKAWDYYTEDKWELEISKDPVACAYVYAALILGSFWLCVQG